MKKFMIIFLGADYGTLGLSPEDLQQRMGQWFAWNQKMEKAGVVENGDALTGDTVRHVSGPNRTVTDRAGSEIKELIGGYYIIKANDLDGAMKIAEDYPDYDLGGTVEIREIVVFDH